MLMYLGARSAFPRMALLLLLAGRMAQHATMWRIEPRNVEHVFNYIKNQILFNRLNKTSKIFAH